MSTINNDGRKKVDRIPAGTGYEGYLWKSNKEFPKICHVEENFEDDLDTKQNPFIVEGWLYDGKAQKSYAIRYLDGEYIRVEYDLSVADVQEVNYQAHDLKQVDHFRVIEHWAPKVDENCAYMPVLRHAWSAFAGFAHAKK